jgi:NAD(P)-dependent dehydrogenase (short-subunit alcohol dehydrogenase family)
MANQLHILVTGTSRGIGESILSALAGHRAVGHSTAGGGGRIAADLSRPDAAEGLWNEAIERLDGRIDVLVNNAGIFEAAPIESEDWTQRWERTLRVNLLASAELCRLAVLHFRARGTGGRIVNVASRAAMFGSITVAVALDGNDRLKGEVEIDLQGVPVEEDRAAFLGEARDAAADAVAKNAGKDEDRLRDAVRLAVRRCATEWSGKKPVVSVLIVRI